MVTVPVLSSTTVSMRRADSSTSGPRIRIPSCAPRPVPTSSAIGVARPSAHGHAMISTATAFAKATSARRPAIEPAGRASRARADHDRHEHRGDPVGQALGRRPCRTAPPRPAGRCGRGRCRRRPASPRPPGGRPRSASRRDGLARCHLDRQALAGQQRPVDGREPSRTTPSVAISSPGRTTNRSPAPQHRQRHAPLAASVEHRDSSDAALASARSAAPALRFARASRYRPTRMNSVTPAATSR